MSLKKILMLSLAIIFAMGIAMSVTGDDANAGHKSKKLRKGIAIAVGATALALAAASSANADRHKPRYDYHHGIGKRENAVAACVHRADRTVRRAGGLYVRLNRVTMVEHSGKNKFKVGARMTGVYSWGHKKSRVWCTVKHDRVITFKYK